MRASLNWLILLAGGCASAPDAGIEYANVRGDRGYCPLCKMWHPRSEMRWATEAEGKHYLFCDPNCRASFAKDPRRYLADEQFRNACSGYRTATFDVNGCVCAGCARSIESILKKHPGVREVRAEYLGGSPSARVAITFDPDVTNEDHLLEVLFQSSGGAYQASRKRIVY